MSNITYELGRARIDDLLREAADRRRGDDIAPSPRSRVLARLDRWQNRVSRRHRRAAARSAAA